MRPCLTSLSTSVIPWLGRPFFKVLWRGKCSSRMSTKRCHYVSPSFSVFGYDAVAKAKNSPDNIFFSLYTFGLEAAGNYLNGSSFIPNKLFDLSDIGIRTMEKAPEIALNGTLITGGGSGSTTPAFIEALLDAI